MLGVDVKDREVGAGNRPWGLSLHIRPGEDRLSLPLSPSPGNDLLAQRVGSISLWGQKPGGDLRNRRIAGSFGPSALTIFTIDRAKTAKVRSRMGANS